MTAIEKPREIAVEAGSLRRSALLLVAGILALVVGFGSALGGIIGAVYTWDQAVAEDVTVAGDASWLAETPVRGPFTMLAQRDIITYHQLESTEGLYYAQMPRQVPQLDENGQPVLDESGEQVMVPNQARTGWITATTLTTALGLGIMAYALAAFAFVVGVTLVAIGFVFLYIRKRAVLL